MEKTHPRRLVVVFGVLRLIEGAEDPLRSVRWTAEESKVFFLLTLTSHQVAFLGLDLLASKQTQILRVPATCSE
jgi:hypothetical protein